MDKYIFRDFESVRNWVTTNKLCRYNFRSGRPNSDDKNNFIFAYDEDASAEDNLHNLEAQLEAHAGRHICGIGWLTEKIMMKLRLEQLEKERKDFEREKKEFEEEKSGVIGSLVNYFAPVAQAMMQKQSLAKVAGTDVEAERIVPVPEDPDEGNQETDDLPDDEATQAYDLLKRFRKIEPNYLKLLESVVNMAEAGDSTYTMAKSFLLK